MSNTFPIQEVSKLVGLPEARIRAMVKAGVCAPSDDGNTLIFSFQDLVKLRAARALFDSDLPNTRLQRVLKAVTGRVPQGGLSKVKLSVEGKHVLVEEEGAAWVAESGQLLLFAGRAPPVEAQPPRPGPPLSLADRRARKQKDRQRDQQEEAMGLFEQALAMEHEDIVGAVDAYQRALELHPGFSDVFVNLGRIAHQAGRLMESVRLYEEALHLAPNDPVPHYNVALVREDLGHLGAARKLYERAIELDPRFADAHYNLALLHERTGNRARTLQHLTAYKRLVDGKA